ncbi:MAG: transglycosylase SLT domain-containing protein [Candidatus Tectomicrobia bacterium]|nr:transglycosylase SLT domain-containing protein [Candidatus Tectomicrobia bacterium]
MRLARAALLLAGLLLGAPPALAAAPPPKAAPVQPPKVSPMPQAVLAAAEGEDAPALLRALKALRSDPDGRGAFLAGYAHLQAGRPGEAVAPLREALGKAPDLKSHILYFLALAAEKLKDDETARHSLQELLKSDPGNPHAPQAYETLARIALRRADPLETARWARGLLRLYPNHDRADAFLQLLAEALEQGAQYGDAVLAWRRLWIDHPESPLAEKALARADAIAPMARPSAPPLQASDHYLRARRLQKLHRYREALEAYRALDRAFPGSPYRLSLRHHSAIALFFLRRTPEARAALEESLRNWPAGSPDRAEARYFLLRNHLRADDKPAFEEEAKTLLQEGANTTWAARALNLLARVREDDGDQAAAARYYEQIIRQYPASPLAPKVLWQIAWLRLQERSEAPALEGFQDLVRRYPSHPLVPSALYWSGVAAERMGERDRAARLYRSGAQGYRHQYYGHLSAEALARLGREGLMEAAWPLPPAEAGFEAWTSPPPGPLEAGALAHWRAAELLASMGLYHLAGEEFERLGGALFFRYRAALAFSRRGFHDRATAILHGQFRDAIRAGGADLPPEFWKAVFPLRARPGKGDGADPLLVNAIIKAESSFDPNAFSPAGAMGLMQIMPGTGRSLAKRANVRFDSEAQLFDPELNVRLGSLYLAGLVKEFGGALIPAIASYNAGRAVVRRWWQKRGNEPLDVFIERIPYEETRNYVKRVLSYYREYRRIYGGSARPPHAPGSPS